MFKKFILTLIAIFIIGSVAQAQNDTVQLENKTVKCKITKMTATELSVEDSGVDEVYQVNEIKSIAFNREPSQFARARSLIESGSNEDALELLTDDVRGTLGGSDFLKQEMDYLLAKVKANIALSGGEVSISEAIKACESFVTNYTRNFHYFDVCEITGNLYASTNTPAGLKKAEEFYDKLGAAPWNDVKMRSLAAKGKIYLKQNNVKDAQAAFSKILQLEDKSSVAERQKLLARMGLAKCKVLTKDYDGAIKDAESLLQNAAPDDYVLNAMGYNTLGLAYMGQGKDKDAVVAFLQVDMLFSRDVESHIESLKSLQALWKSMAMPNRVQECAEKLQDYGITTK